MPLKQFKIVLDNPKNSYYAGSVVSGRVLLSLDKPIKTKGIELRILGRASLSWTETKYKMNNEGKSESHKETFSAEEQYISFKRNLLGSSSENSEKNYTFFHSGGNIVRERLTGDIELPIGNYVYPFKTTLPLELPTGFNGEHGSVKYLVEVAIHQPWKTDHEVRHFFQVITPMDLNNIALAKKPIKNEKEKYFCCCCCKSGPLTMVVNVPQSGFVPGQVMPVLVEIDNASDVAVNEVKFKLVKSITWIAKEPRYREIESSEDLLETKAEGVAPNSSRTWTEILKIPNMTFLNLDHCSIIKLEFLLKVSTAVNVTHRNFECSSKWILGNVPIASVPFAPGIAYTSAPEFAKPSAPDPSLIDPSLVLGNAVAVDDRLALNQYF